MEHRVSPFLAFAAAFGVVASWWVVGSGLAPIWRVGAAVGAVGCVLVPRAGTSSSFGLVRALVGGMFLGCVVGGEAGWASKSVESDVLEERTRGVVRGRIVEAPEPLRRGWGVTVEVSAIDGSAVEPSTTARLFVPPERLEMNRPPLPGDRIRVFAQLEPYPAKEFPGRVAPRRRMARRGVTMRGVAEDTVETTGRMGGIDRAIARRLASLRVRYLRRLYRHTSSPAVGYAAAMTAGARGMLTGDQVDPFRRTGTGHLLAISGLHLGILAALLWKAFGAVAGLFPALFRRWGRRRICALPVVATLGAYVWAIGAPVSAFRAFVMVAAVVGALAVRRPVDSLHGLAAAAVVLIAGDPSRACGLGFQLSFAATGAILWFLQRRPAAWTRDPDPTRSESAVERWVRRVGVGAGASLSATLATWPILLAWHGWVPFDAVWVNLVVTPVASTLLVPALFGGAALTFALPGVGTAILEFGGRAMAMCAGLLRWIAERPPRAIVLGRISALAAVVAEIGVFIWIGSRGRRRAIATGAVVIGLALLPGRVLGGGSQQVRVHFIPVGQGDATLVEFPGGRTMLVDAGGQIFGSDPGRSVVAPYLRRVGVGRLDWVVGTHADVDHVGGIPAVAERLRPRSFLYDPGAGSGIERAVSSVEGYGTRLQPVVDERRWRVGRVSVRVLRPATETSTPDNDRSLVTVLEYGGTRVVLPADIEAATERRLRERIAGPAAILKVPHHGSKTSSSSALLEHLQPRVAVVSAGRFNPFGHPHASVERRYRRRGVEWFETAENGLVRARISPDGSWSVRAVRGAKSVRSLP